LQRIIAAAEALEAFKAFYAFRCFTARIMQRWVYNSQSDNKTCDDCDWLDGKTFEIEDVSEFEGVFPYGEAEGADLFHPNIHPNCRCEIILLETYLTD
jgi:hypothetical protein